ncbi:hypothetical protein BGX34_003113 [Mortierella sp. NVP85]|nr:hypothetical protein BGX34_003113 [Mortierella sp. NVP85]
MGRRATASWFFISLNEPSTILPDPTPSSTTDNTEPEPGLNLQKGRVDGTVTIRLIKPAKVKSLSLAFTGIARTSFYFDASSISSATPCIPCDKYNYKCILVDHKQAILPIEKVPHILPVGTHEFPFSIPINDHLPAVVSSRHITVSYQAMASLQLVSLFPFTSPSVVTKPVILLQRDELPSDTLFNTAIIRVKSKESSRLSTNVSLPCSVLPLGATIPIILNLSLKGNATTVTKITIEMLESIYACHQTESGQIVETLIDERLATRQNCPPQDWPSSSSDEPIEIPKRLMFKVPQLPLPVWTKEQSALKTNWRSSLEKGFCHPSGTYADANLRIAHSLRVLVNVRGLSDSDEPLIEEDYGESDASIWIVGNQGYKEDESYPPAYYRSFSTTLVEGDKICELDQQAMEALRDDPLFTLLPPCYEDALEGSSAPSLPRINSIRNTCQPSLDPYGVAELTDSHETYLRDLAAYTDRYSRANPNIIAM